MLALSYTPWTSDRIALVLKIFEPVSYFGGIRITLIFLKVLPGLLLLYAGPKIASFLTGEATERGKFEAQERTLFSVGIAAFGVWELISGLSRLATIVAMSIWEVFGDAGYSVSRSTGIMGVTKTLVGISILFLFRALVRRMNSNTQEADIPLNS